MLFDYSNHREIYLIFHDDTHYFGSSLVKKGFKHVFAIERQALGWLCFDPSRSTINALILPASWQTDIMPEFKKNNSGATVLGLVVSDFDKSNYPRAGIISCVSAVQYYLGVFWPHILTPYKLYNKIVKSTPNHIKVLSLCQEAEGLKEKHRKQHPGQI